MNRPRLVLVPFDADIAPSPQPPPTPRSLVSARPPAASPRDTLYLPVALKFVIVTVLASAWMVLSIHLSRSWLDDLSNHVGPLLAVFVITFIAYVPGFMNAFLVAAILFDRRPPRRAPRWYPPLDVLVACYQEAGNIEQTLASVVGQDYPGPLTVCVIDDGSTDGTAARAEAIARAHGRPGLQIRVLRQPRNAGKAAALNRGFASTASPLVVTLDGDCTLRADALGKVVQRFLSDPPGTVAVAGAVVVRNSRDGWLARAQEWDYFHGIAAVKRVQSLFHGTLVAQGAFSLYTRSALHHVGGWPDCVGEDIVLSWALLGTGARIGYAEDSLVFTRVPATLRQFARQRQRWSRGLMEAFARHGRLLLVPRMSTLFIWWNLLFVPLDLVYTFAFVPGLVLAAFGVYWIAGPMTLLVLPLALVWNAVIHRVQSRMHPEFFLSSDAGGATTLRLGLGWDTWRIDREHWRGIRVERARFAGPGWSHVERRVYLQAAGTFGDAAVDDTTWRWRLAAGSNGDDLLGSAAVHTEGPRRREVFVERELVETREGTRRGQVYTFVGATADHPFGEHTNGTLLAGVQHFGDGNLRTHLRGSVAHAFAPAAGLSVQLRTRGYDNSRPAAGDYYSPAWYGEAVIGLGWRRFFGGHRVGVFAGAGVRGDSGSDGWRRTRVLQFGYETPRRHASFARISAGWSDSPVVTSTAGDSHAYRYLMFEGVVAF